MFPPPPATAAAGRCARERVMQHETQTGVRHVPGQHGCGVFSHRLVVFPRNQNRGNDVAVPVTHARVVVAGSAYRDVCMASLRTWSVNIACF